MAGGGCDRCSYAGEPCPRCLRAARAREAGSDEVERVDPHGRDADWNFPRGYGGVW